MTNPPPTARYHQRHPLHRAATLLLVLIGHALVALLLIVRPPSASHVKPEQLSLFDVAPPPPPVATPPAEPPRPAERLSRPSGSPPRIDQPLPVPAAAGAATTPTVTLAASAPPAPPERVGIGLAEELAGLGAGLASGTGTGSGTGSGAGDGSGGGGSPAWQRAEWIEQPPRYSWRQVWPARAARSGIGGEVDLACIVPRPGPVRRCFVIRERPADAGFGAAALALSRLPSFRIRPVRKDAKNWAKVPIRVPVVFEASAKQAPAATSAAAVPPAPPPP